MSITKRLLENKNLVKLASVPVREIDEIETRRKGKTVLATRGRGAELILKNNFIKRKCEK